jgi:ATP/maltotriose-dependent transcriptional regulator MalT
LKEGTTVREHIFQPDESEVPDYEAIMSCLNPREEEILGLVADGASSAEIANELQITIIVVWQAQQRIAVLGAMWENCRNLIDSLS